ncbi:MAG: hypothetical protein ACK50A_04975 [Sphingobacteriaceae bacterium]|jgi:hypothetical protein
MTTQEHIDQFSETLKKILKSEIELGNSIAETSKGWPQKDSIIISLKQPFSDNYNFENVQFKKIDDPHYWKSEYIDKLTNHILACRF